MGFANSVMLLLIIFIIFIYHTLRLMFPCQERNETRKSTGHSACSLMLSHAAYLAPVSQMQTLLVVVLQILCVKFVAYQVREERHAARDCFSKTQHGESLQINNRPPSIETGSVPPSAQYGVMLVASVSDRTKHR